MKKLFTFETLITPQVITVIYWLLLLASLVGGLTMMFSGYQGLTFGKFLLGLLSILGGAIGARIWCELLIVLFKIHENLRTLAQK